MAVFREHVNDWPGFTDFDCLKVETSAIFDKIRIEKQPTDESPLYKKPAKVTGAVPNWQPDHWHRKYP